MAGRTTERKTLKAGREEGVDVGKRENADRNWDDAFTIRSDSPAQPYPSGLVSEVAHRPNSATDYILRKSDATILRFELSVYIWEQYFLIS